MGSRVFDLQHKAPCESKICKLEKEKLVLPVVQGRVVGGIMEEKKGEGGEKGNV